MTCTAIDYTQLVKQVKSISWKQKPLLGVCAVKMLTSHTLNTAVPYWFNKWMATLATGDQLTDKITQFADNKSLDLQNNGEPVFLPHQYCYGKSKNDWIKILRFSGFIKSYKFESISPSRIKRENLIRYLLGLNDI